VKKLIQARLEGREVAPVEKPRKPEPVVDLMAALKQSLSRMEGHKKPAARVEAAQQDSEAKLERKRSARRPGKKAA